MHTKKRACFLQQALSYFERERDGVRIRCGAGGCTSRDGQTVTARRRAGILNRITSTSAACPKHGD